MFQRYKKMGDQLGRSIPEAGTHIPHVVVGILRKTRNKWQDRANSGKENGGSKVAPLVEYNPHPTEFALGDY